MQKTLGDSSSAGEHENEDEDEDEGDDEGESAGSNEDFEAGKGVEEMLRVLEEGGALPDIEGLMEAENPQVLFMALPCPALPCPALRFSGQCGLCAHAIQTLCVEVQSQGADFVQGANRQHFVKKLDRCCMMLTPLCDQPCDHQRRKLCHHK